MSILSLTSGQSTYRGYEYAREDRVGPVEEREERVFSAPVRGSGGAVYDVTTPESPAAPAPTPPEGGSSAST